jgi:hypothetical protein
MRTNLWPQTDLMAAHLVRDEGVAGSNPATPTIQNQRLSGVGRPLKSVGHQFGHRNKNYASWPQFASWASNDFTIDDRESPVRQRQFSLRTRSRPLPVIKRMARPCRWQRIGRPSFRCRDVWRCDLRRSTRSNSKGGVKLPKMASLHLRSPSFRRWPP